MITIKHLTQSYRKKVVLDDLSLQVEEKEICALVGRNGAGKSTLIHSMMGILPIKKGEITLNGVPHYKKEWKKAVAYLPEKFQLYPSLTGEENIRFFASLDSKSVDDKNIKNALEQVGLWDDRHNFASSYSKGMLQRLGLGIMLYYDAELLILDEPTSGLDPIGRREILEILKSLTNKTILLSSHHMEEIRKVCTHVAFLENGEIYKYTIDEFSEQIESGGF